MSKVFWCIVNDIYDRGLEERDLFTTIVDPDEIYQVREYFDTGVALENFSVHFMAEVLTSFLSNLSTPIDLVLLFRALDINTQNIQYLRGSFWKICYL